MHPNIWSSVVPFSSCLLSFPASGSFPMNRLFASGCIRCCITCYGVGPLCFWPPRSLSAHVQCLSCPENGTYVTSWSFTQTESSSVSARAVILKCPQETKLDYLPCYSYSISKCKPEADCKHLDSSHLPPSLGNVKQRLVVNAWPHKNTIFLSICLRHLQQLSLGCYRLGSLSLPYLCLSVLVIISFQSLFPFC